MTLRDLLSAVVASSRTPTERLVLFVLARYAHGETGEAWPSLSTLARETGAHRATVVRALDALETDGLLERREGRRSTTYAVAWERLSAPAPAPAEPVTKCAQVVAPCDGRTTRLVAPRDATSRTMRLEVVAPCDTNDPIEQIKEHVPSSLRSEGSARATVEPVERSLEARVAEAFVDGLEAGCGARAVRVEGAIARRLMLAMQNQGATRSTDELFAVAEALGAEWGSSSWAASRGFALNSLLPTPTRRTVWDNTFAAAMRAAGRKTHGTHGAQRHNDRAGFGGVVVATLEDLASGAGPL